jgi:uncharacterized protein (DUF302 family)
MADQPGTITYLIAEPFQQALKSLRRAFSARDLKIVGDLNVSYRIRQRLLIDTAPCVVLYVWPRLGQTLGADPEATAIAPLHVVVSGRGKQSEVHVLRALPSDRGLLDGRAMAALNQIKAEIGRAIEKIGMRVTLNA